MNIHFALFGSAPFNPDYRAGDTIPNEPALLLRELATEWPAVTWKVSSRLNGTWLRHPNPPPWPKNVVFPPRPKELLEPVNADAIVVWSTFSLSAALPETLKLDGTRMVPRQDRDTYFAPVARLLNRFPGNEVWLNNDFRSIFKTRDVRPPHNVLSQHRFDKTFRSQWSESGLWTTQNHAAGTDTVGLPLWKRPRFVGRRQAGPLRTMASLPRKFGRTKIAERYRIDNLGVHPRGEYLDFLSQEWGTFMLPPASRCGWITLRLWEAWGHGCLTFMPPDYDSQDVSLANHIGVGEYLRVDGLEDLEDKVAYLLKKPRIANEIRRACWQEYTNRQAERRHITWISAYLGI